MDDPKASNAPAAEPDSTPSRGGHAGPSVRSALRRTSVCISSHELFAGATEVQIEHRGALYRLQQTSLGKLILIK
jgi:hemin uptake protein HemP